jgi:hypothetical protein
VDGFHVAISSGVDLLLDLIDERVPDLADEFTDLSS